MNAPPPGLRRAQWQVLLASSVCYLCYYTGRQNFGWAIPGLRHQLGLSNTEIGWISGTMLACYGAGQVVSGALGDRFGGRWLVALGAGLSCLLNWLTSFASGFWTLLLPWALNGFAQSMGFAPATRLIANWWGPRERGQALGIFNFAAGLASAVTFAAAILVLEVLSWAWIFRLPVLLMPVAGLLFFLGVRDRPEECGFAGAAGPPDPCAGPGAGESGLRPAAPGRGSPAGGSRPDAPAPRSGPASAGRDGASTSGTPAPAPGGPGSALDATGRPTARHGEFPAAAGAPVPGGRAAEGVPAGGRRGLATAAAPRPGRTSVGEDLRALLGDRRFVLATLGFGLDNWARLGLLVWVPVHVLGPRWREAPDAAWITLALPIGMALGALAAGFLADRLFGGDHPRLIAGCLAVASLVTIALGFVPPDARGPALALLFLAGFLVFGPVSSFSALATRVGRDRVGIGIGVMNAVGYGVAALGDPVIGAVLDLTGRSASLFVVTAGAALGGAGCGLALVRAWRERGTPPAPGGGGVTPAG